MDEEGRGVPNDAAAEIENLVLRHSEEDGYDYSQHLRPITGEGVFVYAGSGVPTKDYADTQTANAPVYLSGTGGDEDNLFDGEEGEISDDFFELAKEDAMVSDEQFAKVLEEYEDDGAIPHKRAHSPLNPVQLDELLDGLISRRVDVSGLGDEDEDEGDGMEEGVVPSYVVDDRDVRAEYPINESAKEDVLRVLDKGEGAEEDSGEEEEYIVEKKEVENPDNWDCESIRTFSTTTSNLPGVVVPQGRRNRRKKRQEGDLSATEPEKPSQPTGSRKGETAEEKKKRKKEVKEFRRARREEKKQRREMFGEERIEQQGKYAGNPNVGRSVIHIG